MASTTLWIRSSFLRATSAKPVINLRRGIVNFNVKYLRPQKGNKRFNSNQTWEGSAQDTTAVGRSVRSGVKSMEWTSKYQNKTDIDLLK